MMIGRRPSVRLCREKILAAALGRTAVRPYL